MFKILIALLLMTTPSWATVQWRNGTNENTILGTALASDIDTITFERIVSPLNDLLRNYRQGMNITYNSAAQLTIKAGSISVTSDGSNLALMLYNANDTTVTWSDIDTGAEASSTTYYVYAIAAASSSTSATFKISTSSTSPSGATYYKRLGYFTNNSGSDIDASTIINDNSSIIPAVQNSILYINNNVNVGGKTISNGFLGRTTTGSVSVSNGTTNYVPSGCYMYGLTRDSDGSAGTLQYACP